MTLHWFSLRKLSLLLGLALLVAIVPAATVSAADGDARVRVVHASPDAPNVDIWVNGSVAISDLAFKEATDYVPLAPGEYQIQVTPTGAPATEAVINATVTLEANTDYTVAAIGEVANIQPLVLVDDNSAPAAGKAHVRVVHASPDAPAVDVAVANGPVLIENLAFGEASDYLPVDAATYDLQVRPTGTDTSALDISGFMAEDGTTYTVFAVGMAGDGSLSALPLVDAKAEMSSATSANPSMPATGAGGTATQAGTSAWLLALGALAALTLTTGTVAVARRAVARR